MKRLPLKWLHLYILLSLLVFIVVQLLKYFSVPAQDWIFYYLNDFLTIPIVATAALHVLWFLKKNRSIRLGFFTVFSLVLLYSLYFEYYLPKISPRYTADVADVFCYAAGGMIFLALQKMK